MQRMERVRRLSVGKAALRMLGGVVFGAVMAGCRAGDWLLPTGVAAVAAAPGPWLFSVTLGVLLTLLTGATHNALRYAAACCVLAGVRLLFGRRFAFGEYPWYEPLLAATVTLSTGAAMELTSGGGVLFLLEAPLAAGLAAVFGWAFSGAARNGQKSRVAEREADAVTGVAALFAYALTSLPFGGTPQGGALCLTFALIGMALRRRLPTATPPVSLAPELRNRVERTAGALRELSGVLSGEGAALSPQAALTPAIDSLCRNCEHAPRCWDTDGMAMADALNAMSGTLGREGQLRDDTLPAPFVERCDKRDSFVDAVNRESQALSRTKTFRESLQGAPSLLKEQVKCFSLVLDDLGDGDDLDCDASLTEFLTEVVGEQRGLRLRAGTGRQGRLRVVGESESRPVLGTLSDLLRESRGVALADPVVWRGEKGWQFVVSEAPALSGSIERHMSPAPGERVMGDSVRDFRTDDMKLVVALSDGMGAGRLAAGKSKLAVDTLEKLMQAGLREGAAMRILNAALLADNEPEVFATVDAAVIDLYSGDVEFVKAGAAPSYILREGRLTRVESRGLPAGVLPEFEAQVTRARVQAGDTVILISDGLLPPGEPDEALREFILSHDRRRGSLARAMVGFCRTSYRHLPQDDMTAVVVDIRRYGEV